MVPYFWPGTVVAVLTVLILILRFSVETFAVNKQTWNHGIHPAVRQVLHHRGDGSRRRCPRGSATGRHPRLGIFGPGKDGNVTVLLLGYTCCRNVLTMHLKRSQQKMIHESLNHPPCTDERDSEFAFLDVICEDFLARIFNLIFKFVEQGEKLLIPWKIIIGSSIVKIDIVKS